DAQTPALREGDVIDQGRLGVDAGTIEVDLFCGARLIVEGPARLRIVSDWLVELESGRLRALVPPAARGFVVRAAEHEIVDLGTEFAVSVAQAGAQVAVVDGEVELRSDAASVRRLTTGQVQQLWGQAGGDWIWANWRRSANSINVLPPLAASAGRHGKPPRQAGRMILAWWLIFRSTPNSTCPSEWSHR
ncbi:MAG: hypothetical protein D6753_15595, partial [Planctomycetota bacterium]